MRRIKSRDTLPEKTVRSLIHGMGYRYRLHGKDLPGKPDLVFSKKHKVIFVHGCFWHQHKGCTNARIQKTNQDFWVPKLEATLARDANHLLRLREMGWEALVIWECELKKDADFVKANISAFLE